MSQNNPLTPILGAQPFIVLDGAMATELEARGCNLADGLWSAKVLLENPQLIADVHLDYFRAGARVAITASYQATPAGFAARGFDEAQSRALISKSVALALRGVSGRRLGVPRRLPPQTRRICRLPPPARGGPARRRGRSAGLRNSAVV